MMHIFIIILAVLCQFAVNATDWSRGVNVRDFGAKGDGIADDTMAIQQALNFIRNLDHRVLLARQPMLTGAPHLGNLPVLGTTSESIKVPELFFPSGNYRITSTLVAGTYLYMRGEKNSKIIQANPDKDILYIRWGFRVQIKNLIFINGHNHIVMWTGNEDTANFTAENCSFENARGTVFFSLNFLNPKGKRFSDRTYGLYEVKWQDEKPILTKNDEKGTPAHNSTLMTFSNCDFINCAKIFHFDCDGAVIENCRVQVSDKATESPFDVKGPVTLINLKATASKAIPGGKAWFHDPFSRCSIYKSSFAVRENSGMPLFYYSNDKPEMRASEIQTYITVKNTHVQCGKHPIILCKGAIPNIIDFENVRDISGKRVMLMGGAEKITRADLKKTERNVDIYEKVLSGKSYFNQEPPYDITLSGCDTISTAGVPDFLRKRIGKPMPEKVFNAVYVPRVRITADDMKKRFRRTLKAVDFGMDTDPKTDDTAAMKRVLKAASQGAAALIELPPVLISISEPLDIPSEIAFMSRGLATLQQNDIKAPIFRGKDQKTLWATNLRLVSGTYGFELQTNVKTKAEILIEKCLFYQQLNSSVSLLAGNGQANLPNHTELLLKRSVFISPVHGLVTNAAHSELHDFWVSTNARMDRSAFITNLGGDMRITDMLGVPMPMTDHRHNHLPFEKDWPYANDTRWFDNYGRLYASDNRYGGEYYGMPLIYNFTKNGTLAIDAGMTCFQHPAMKQCMVYYAETPEVSMIRNVGWLIQWSGAAACKYPAGHPEPEIHIRNFQFQKDSFKAR